MYNLLLVDDEPLIKVAFQSAVEWGKNGFLLAATASNGQEALRELPQVWVESAVCSAAEPLIARIQITWKGGGAEIEVTCDGDI